MTAEFNQLINNLERLREQPARAGSFERFAQALNKLDLVYPDPKAVILIAGTNGKGSVAKTLEVLWREIEPAIGLYTSPHMMHTGERIRSHGRNLSSEEFVKAYKLVEPAGQGLELGHFEWLTLIMAEVFFGGRVREPVRRAVIEVGLGGRLDPTRLIPHHTAVITCLGLDHVEILGGTLPAIAREKFAIASPGGLVVHAPVEDSVRAVVQEAEARTRGLFIETPIFPSRIERDSGQLDSDARWILKTPWGEQALRLKGQRAIENTSLALSTLQAMGVGDLGELLPALSKVHWPCRMEKFVLQNRRLYLSGDHNVQGVQSLLEILENLSYRTVHLVVGIGAAKAATEMLQQLHRIPRMKLILTISPFRGANRDQFAQQIEEGAEFVPEPEHALAQALGRAGPDDLVLVTGSLYLAGSLRRLIVEKKFGPYAAPDEHE